MMTDREKAYCSEILKRIDRLRRKLGGSSLCDQDSMSQWYDFLSSMRAIQGNLSNDISFIATLLAKEYLNRKFSVQFDAAEKAQGAPGIDIDLTTSKGVRIVAEIKTTVPYKIDDFGAQQADSFKKDFAKLREADARHKFLFVSEDSAFSVLKKEKYQQYLSGITVVHLRNGEEYGSIGSLLDTWRAQRRAAHTCGCKSRHGKKPTPCSLDGRR